MDGGSDRSAPRDDGPGGPPAWAILLACALVVAALAGGFAAWRTWRDDDPEQVAVAVTVVPETVVETTVEPDESTLFTRVTQAGIEVRATSTEGDFGFDDRRLEGGDGSDVPGHCEPVAELQVWAITARDIVQGGLTVTRTAPPRPSPVAMWSGEMDGTTILGFAIQVDATVTSVRLSAPNGLVDEMEPVDGVAVVAVEAPADLVQNMLQGGRGAGGGIAVTSARADGTTRRAVGDDLVRGPPLWTEECQATIDGGSIPTTAPPTLPSLREGGEQPADPAAARREIETHLDLLYGADDAATRKERLAVIDDPYGVVEAMNQVREGGFADAADSASVTIDELVFVSAADAVYRYDLDTSSADFPDQLGRARLIDGVWKITRGTLCQDLSKAGATCSP